MQATRPQWWNPPASALLVTNHLNLMYMLAAGLLMPPSGFSGKHYRDPLAAFPGWIPLFIGEAFKAAIEEAVSEADHLNPCLAEVSLRHLAGRMMILRDSGIGVLRFPAELDGTERVIFVPAPLPASWIETILFRSNDEKRTCEADARDFGNVPLSDFARKVANTALRQQALRCGLASGFRLAAACGSTGGAACRRRRHGNAASSGESGTARRTGLSACVRSGRRTGAGDRRPALRRTRPVDVQRRGPGERGCAGNPIRPGSPAE